MGRDAGKSPVLMSKSISIHAPRVGRDAAAAAAEASEKAFQSTRPVWGATDGAAIATVEDGISIHAPRVGRDLTEAMT